MSWAAMDVSDWLLQLALVQTTTADDQSFIRYFQQRHYSQEDLCITGKEEEDIPVVYYYYGR